MGRLVGSREHLPCMAIRAAHRIASLRPISLLQCSKTVNQHPDRQNLTQWSKKFTLALDIHTSESSGKNSPTADLRAAAFRPRSCSFGERLDDGTIVGSAGFLAKYFDSETSSEVVRAKYEQKRQALATRARGCCDLMVRACWSRPTGWI